ncbi:MAG TPA: PDZ domain-containing protein [bacterium]
MQGYYRFPTIHDDTVIFVSEDDLWTVSIKDPVCRRLTSNLGEVAHPFLSPDGKWVAFTGREEGHPEVYCMPSQGGVAKRLTFLGATNFIAGWTKDSQRILFATTYQQWYPGSFNIFSVDREKDIPQLIKAGPARTISFGPGKSVVVGRNTGDPSRWKRYRGGTVGELWVDAQGKGNFKKLLTSIKSNFASPMWISNRIYFISDHEGVGNIYSCLPAGKNIKRHTNHVDYYARNARTDGKNIVYHAGSDIFILYPASGRIRKLKISYNSPRVQTNRKFVEAAHYLEDYAIHPQGERVSVTSRGRVFSMANWEGPVSQNGKKQNARYRLGRWLADGKRMVVVTDEKGDDTLQIYGADATAGPQSLPKMDIGRPIEIEPSPIKSLLALTNQRYELILVNVQTKKRVVLDKSKYQRITGPAWSPDGEWIAYSFWDSERTSCIKICNVLTRKTYMITKPVLRDFSPSFDPDGKYLYFLSNRHFDPTYDTMQFALGFPANIKAYLVVLSKETPSPFKYTQKAPIGFETPDLEKEAAKARKKTRTVIDLDDIANRVIPLPIPEGRYGQISGLKEKAVLTSFPVEGSKYLWMSDYAPPNGTLMLYDMKDLKLSVITSGILDFKVTNKNGLLIYRSRNALRVIKPVEKVDAKLDRQGPGPRSGWIDLSRVKVMVEPRTEWQQMYRDVWRLQRDHFWTSTMSGIDWQGVYDKYYPLLQRVGTRSEFSDLIWEMQGELGTSHAYEWGGDYRLEPQYRQGFLGADLVYDRKFDAYRIAKLMPGDSWDEHAASPLIAPGLKIKNNDLILAVNGQRVSRRISPQELLVNRAGADVLLTVTSPTGKNKRSVTVKTLPDESLLRYREWIEANRQHVHEISKNRIGYVHIPDMGPFGFAEFHRYFLTEIQYPAMIVDIRFNRGGHVSELLIERLRRKRVGYNITRWRKQPFAYPDESVMGPVVGITDEHAGSDGDIFSHCFKLYKIGPLIGKRTWGGVIGISPYYGLSDGGLTTQPEYSFWFEDVGWGVENYGTDPDIVVEIRPQDAVQGKDPQMARAIAECLKLLRKQKPKIPEFGKKPNLAIPKILVTRR